MEVRGDQLVFAGRSGYGALTTILLLIGGMLVAVGIFGIATHREPKLGTFVKEDGTEVTRELSDGCIRERAVHPDGRTSSSSQPDRRPVLAPFMAILGGLFVAVGLAFCWFTLGERLIDRQRRLIITKVPFLGSSEDSFDDFVEVRVSEVTYRAERRTVYTYFVNIMGRRQGNVIEVSKSESVVDARYDARHVAEFTGLPLVDEVA